MRCRIFVSYYYKTNIILLILTIYLYSLTSDFNSRGAGKPLKDHSYLQLMDHVEELLQVSFYLYNIWLIWQYLKSTYFKFNIGIPNAETRVREAHAINPQERYITAIMDGKHFPYLSICFFSTVPFFFFLFFSYFYFLFGKYCFHLFLLHSFFFLIIICSCRQPARTGNATQLDQYMKYHSHKLDAPAYNVLVSQILI